MEKIILNAAEHGDMLVDILRCGGYIPLSVTGISMMPLLRPERDIVWLKAWAPGTLKPGRILLFRRSDGSFILHRIRRVYADGRILMNGDAQRWCEITDEAHAVAVAWEITRGGRRMPCTAWRLRLWDLLWYPTRPLRPALFRLNTLIKSCLSKAPKGSP